MLAPFTVVPTLTLFVSTVGAITVPVVVHCDMAGDNEHATIALNKIFEIDFCIILFF
jgi:hypothetical protein